MKARWVTVYLIVVVASTLLDTCTTFLLSPDLRHEANPVVMHLGRSWTVLLLIKGIGIVVSGLLFYAGLAILQTRRHGGLESGGFLAPLSWSLFRRETSLLRFCFGMPRDMTALLGIILLSGASAIVMGNLVAGMVNSVTLFTSKTIISPWGCWAIVGVSGTILTIVLANTFLRSTQIAEPVSGANRCPSQQLRRHG